MSVWYNKNKDTRHPAYEHVIFVSIFKFASPFEMPEPPPFETRCTPRPIVSYPKAMQSQDTGKAFAHLPFSCTREAFQFHKRTERPRHKTFLWNIGYYWVRVLGISFRGYTFRGDFRTKKGTIGAFQDTSHPDCVSYRTKDNISEISL